MRCLSKYFTFGLGPNLWYTFDGASARSGRSEIR